LRRSWALAVLAMAQFVTILDAAIVNVALPSIHGTADNQRPVAPGRTAKQRGRGEQQHALLREAQIPLRTRTETTPRWPGSRSIGLWSARPICLRRSESRL
jgi:hypothetical protein